MRRKMTDEMRKRGRKPKSICFRYDGNRFTVDDLFRRYEKTKGRISKVAISVKLRKMIAAGKARVVGKVCRKTRGRPFLVYALTRAQCLRLPQALCFTVKEVHEVNKQRSIMWTRIQLNQKVARGELEAVNIASGGVGRPLRLYGVLPEAAL